MSSLIKIAGWGGAPRASVIFVHGLGGHAYDTWRKAPSNDTFWRDLAVSFDKIALVHKQSGDRTKARDFLRQGQAIMARLTKLSPDNATWKQDLARFDQEIAALAPSRPEHGRSPRTPHSRR